MSSKSNFSNITAKRYALALHELSKESSELDRIETESKGIQELFQHSSEFRNLVKDPTNNKNKQMNAIKKMGSRFQFTNTFAKFLCLLCVNRRLFFLDSHFLSEPFTQVYTTSTGKSFISLILIVLLL